MTDSTARVDGVTTGSDTFDPAAARRRSAPWISGVRGIAGLGVLLVVLGHAGLPTLGGGTVGADLLVVVLGFEIVVWATAHGIGAVGAPRSRQRVVAPLVLVVAVSITAAVWWSTTSFEGGSSGTMWDQLGAELTVAGQDAVGVQDMWSQSRAWPASAGAQALAALAATVGVAIAIGWVIRRFTVAGRPLTGRSLVLVSCLVFGLVIVVAVAVVLDLLPTSYVAGPVMSVAMRAWEMALGALVGALVVTGLLPIRVHRLLGATAVTLLVLAVGWPDALAVPRGSLVGVAGAVLIADAASAMPSRGVRRIVDSSPLQITGRFGFCWYLWHLPVLLLAPLIIGSALSWVQSAELMLLALWAAGLTYAVLGRRRVGAGSLPIEDHPHVHGHASIHLPTALRSWQHAPRAAAGVGSQVGPVPHFEVAPTPPGTTGGRR
jgi:peptidoglycan/LPS O-acetylase OafA/YrhL